MKLCTKLLCQNQSHKIYFFYCKELVEFSTLSNLNWPCQCEKIKKSGSLHTLKCISIPEAMPLWPSKWLITDIEYLSRNPKGRVSFECAAPYFPRLILLAILQSDSWGDNYNKKCCHAYYCQIRNAVSDSKKKWLHRLWGTEAKLSIRHSHSRPIFTLDSVLCRENLMNTSLQYRHQACKQCSWIKTKLSGKMQSARFT